MSKLAADVWLEMEIPLLLNEAVLHVTVAKHFVFTCSLSCRISWKSNRLSGSLEH